MKKFSPYRYRIIGVLAVLALASLACGGLLSQPTPTPLPTATPLPTPTPPPPPTATPAPAGATMIIENASAQTVCYVYVSPTSSDTWGDDQLGPDTVIGSGERFTLTDIPPGTYDLRATDCDGNNLDLRFGVVIDASGFTWTIATSSVSLTLENQSGALLCFLYISPTTDDTWGLNQLPEGFRLSTGSTYTITGIPAGTYDLRVETCESDPSIRLSAERYGVDLNTDFTWTITP
ncbi:MAG TPA: hypothetical protein ENI95_15325 [Chloroflexi bacterium]|nr:hypothetical protein [Chloroflexota bacterium]